MELKEFLTNQSITDLEKRTYNTKLVEINAEIVDLLPQVAQQLTDLKNGNLTEPLETRQISLAFTAENWKVLDKIAEIYRLHDELSIPNETELDKMQENVAKIYEKTDLRIIEILLSQFTLDTVYSVMLEVATNFIVDEIQTAMEIGDLDKVTALLQKFPKVLTKAQSDDLFQSDNGDDDNDDTEN